MSEEHTSPNEVSASGIGVDGSEQGPAPTPNWREFIDGLDKLNTTLGPKLDSIKDVVTDGMRPPPPPPPDFEQMNNSDLVTHVTGSVQKMVQEAIMAALQPVTDQLTKVQTDLVNTRGELSIKEMRAAHKDLTDWKDEMIELVGENPTLTVNKVYLLARALNPEKARQLDLKYNPPPPKPRPFGGLLPSGNGKATEPILSGRDATTAAYREVTERHPGILPLLRDL